ncbi:hypothetical protein ACFSYH_06605 [Populibacterium corticicola]|uniref:Uncharacterized protein n=1 Tax=Populibacterium corticicola TaxID=1812826 RepID=A0ABW5XHD0_9MICO
MFSETAVKQALRRALTHLAERRPVFHSEADFQYELAHQLPVIDSSLEIRLERPVRIEGAATFNVDMMIHQSGCWYVIELKYLTAALTHTYLGEEFILRSHDARDLGRYDILKDVSRIETIVDRGLATAGFSITVTNDKALWTAAQRNDLIDLEFHLHEGRVVEGELAWGERAGLGTRERRQAPVFLRDRYQVSWGEYSHIPAERNGIFKFLMFDIGPSGVR